MGGRDTYTFGMRPGRIAALVGVVLCALGAAWSCSSFDESTAGATDAGTDGASEAATDASPPDSFAPDASGAEADAGVDARSPCPGDGGTVLFTSSFDNGAGLAGWSPAPPVGDATLSGGDGGVARGEIHAGNTGAAYAVMSRGPLPSHFAVRFSFAMSSLEQGYIIHQALDGAGAANVSFSLQPSGWTLAAPGMSTIVGAAGAKGAWHTLTYRFVSGKGGGGVATATLDSAPEVTLDLSGGAGIYSIVQLGPFWPVSTASAPVVVDYDDVTVWDCAK
jgi:hypothetical protein